MRILVFLAVMLSGGVLAGVVNATTMVRLDLAAMANAAQLIVHARCLGLDAKWENGAIWSFVDFQVIETMKGVVQPGEILRVRLAGGRSGHVQTRIDGVPDFFVGETAVLFLEKTSAGDLGITGWAQGTFRVWRDTGGRVSVTQESSEFPTYDRKTKKFFSDGIRNMEIGEFREKVKSLIRN